MDLKVPTTEKPTFWNKAALLGGLIGTAMIPGASILGALATIAAGTAVGGIIGKQNMETDLREGKTAKKPSFWNIDTAIGVLGGRVIGGLAAAAVLTVGLGIASLIAAPALATGVAIASVITAVGVGLGTEITGLIRGGDTGKERMQKDYAFAQHTQQAPALSPSVTPDGKNFSASQASHPEQAAPNFVANERVRRAQPAIVGGR